MSSPSIIGFNPCFSGLASSTLQIGSGNIFGKCFNPCFSGLASSTNERRAGELEENIVSILVLVDQPLRHAEKVNSFSTFTVSILVLVDQPLRLRGKMPPNAFATCFNPCFSGLASSTKRFNAHAPMVKEFQSLFQWISLFDSIELKEAEKYGCVSILVLVDQPLRHDR